ncbi:MAG: tripartite tricarboxylate transporter substrate binding protein [Burkholderiaceae bacterium]|nr:tripartite tricarboxylate transporter substrate binding protein [Burkholderiaceae bacterium]
MRTGIGRGLLAAALFAVAAFAHAQTFPNKTVRIVVPQTPGGASDTLARVVATKLGAHWNQPVVVENRAGAGGNIGMEVVAKSPADGYTLLMSYVGTHAINGALYSNLPFDPEKDFAAVATLATLPFVAVVNPNLPVKTMSELAELAKKQPVSYGSAGNGSVNHLLGEMFNAAAGVKMLHIPYRGAAPAMTDLVGGQIQVVFTSMPSVAGFIRNGSLRAVAVTSAKRAVAFGDIPTIAESGYPGFDVNPWFGLFAPAGTPAAVIGKLNTDINEVLRAPDVIEKFTAAGAEPYLTTPAQFGAVLKDDIAKWSKVVRDSGAKVD